MKIKDMQQITEWLAEKMGKKRKFLNLELGAVLYVAISLIWLSKRALSGYLKGTWGYGEFWINYSAGYVRRGMSGELIHIVSNLFGMSPYICVTVLCILFNALNFGLLTSLAKNIVRSKPTRIFITLNPTLTLFYLDNPSAFIRKDQLIIFGMLFHAYAARKYLSNKLSYKAYILIAVFLSIFALFVGQNHEIQALFLPVHLFIYHFCKRKETKSKFRFDFVNCTYVLGGLVTILTSVFYHGSKAQSQSIIASLPKSERIVTGAIDAIGWSASEGLALSVKMFNSPGTLVCFGLIALIGPLALWFVLRFYHKANRPAILILILAPQLSLFLLGWDWGRWLAMISYSIISIFAVCIQVNQRSSTDRIGSLYISAVIILFIICWRMPECCVRAPEEALFPLMNFLHKIGIHITG